MVATLNNGGGFYSSELYFHEAKLHGAKVEMPCINTSEWLNTIYSEIIFIGFYILHELEHEVVERFLKERFKNGSFKSLADFVNRVKISLEQLIILIRAGAFRFTGKTKKELLWDAHYLLGHSKKTTSERTLFNTNPKEFKLPELWKHELEDTFDEIELLGFPVHSPINLLEEPVQSNVKAAGTCQSWLEKRLKLPVILSIENQLPQKMVTVCILAPGSIWTDSGWIPFIFQMQSRKNPFTGPGYYHIKGKVVEEYGFYSIETQWMQRLKYRNLDSLN